MLLIALSILYLKLHQFSDKGYEMGNLNWCFWEAILCYVMKMISLIKDFYFNNLLIKSEIALKIKSEIYI